MMLGRGSLLRCDLVTIHRNVMAATITVGNRLLTIATNLRAPRTRNAPLCVGDRPERGAASVALPI
jgi:hypothetical protein